MVSNFARWATGIRDVTWRQARYDAFFIDHGMGVVIGEDRLKSRTTSPCIQGVTLGRHQLGQGQRHPTLEDGVGLVARGQCVWTLYRWGAGCQD